MKRNESIIETIILNLHNSVVGYINHQWKNFGGLTSIYRVHVTQNDPSMLSTNTDPPNPTHKQDLKENQHEHWF